MIGIGTPAENDGDDRELLVPLVRDGEVVGREPLEAARERHAAARAELPPAAQQMSRGEPVIPTVFEGDAALMALISCELFSESLMRATTITVILPQATEEQIGLIDQPLEGPPPVLYLLHGLSDDHTAWQRYTSIERYAVARGLAVVMPAVDRSFYANEAHGHRYWDWVSEELPRLVGQFFRVSQTREDTFVAGLSMGGYGALKHAFTHPDRYAAVGHPLRRRQDPGTGERPAPARDRGPGVRRRDHAGRRRARAPRGGRPSRRCRSSTSAAAPRRSS